MRLMHHQEHHLGHQAPTKLTGTFACKDTGRRGAHGGAQHLRVSCRYSTHTPFSSNRPSLRASLFDLMLSKRDSDLLMGEVAPLGHPQAGSCLKPCDGNLHNMQVSFSCTSNKADGCSLLHHPPFTDRQCRLERAANNSWHGLQPDFGKRGNQYIRCYRFDLLLLLLRTMRLRTPAPTAGGCIQFTSYRRTMDLDGLTRGYNKHSWRSMRKTSASCAASMGSPVVHIQVHGTPHHCLTCLCTCTLMREWRPMSAVSGVRYDSLECKLQSSRQWHHVRTKIHD